MSGPQGIIREICVSLFSSIIGAAVGAYWGIDSGLAVHRKTQVEHRERLVQALLSETNHNQLILKGAIAAEMWSEKAMNPSHPRTFISDEVLSEGVLFDEDASTELKQGLIVYLETVTAANSTMNMLEQRLIQGSRITADDIEWFDSVAYSCLAATYVFQKHLRNYMTHHSIEEKADVEGSKRYFEEFMQMYEQVKNEIKRPKVQDVPDK